MYLKPFERVVREAEVLGIMSSYNDFDGVPVSASRYLLVDLLREDFGFKGYVVSDSDAVLFLYSKHRVATSVKDAIRLFLVSGGNVRTEFNPPDNFVLPLRELIAEDKISMEVIDARVRDVLRVKFQLGLFDNPYRETAEVADGLVHQEKNRQVALRAARESIVLLKNENHVLPLAKDIGSILKCGPNAQAIDHSISRYGPTGGDVISVLDGVAQQSPENTDVRFVKGCSITDSRWPESEILYEPPIGEDAANIEAAVAAKVDVVVAVLGGESEKTVGEGRSRTDLTLTGYQRNLVEALHATGKPVLVVLINGRCWPSIDLFEHVPAIVEAWFPGEWCGRAVADVLFGDYNPGGKLPVTFPRTVGQLPQNFPFKPGSQAGQGRNGDPNGVGNSQNHRRNLSIRVWT